MYSLATKVSDITIEEILQFGFPVLFGVMIISLILYAVMKHRRDTENDAQPVLEANAKVVDKQQVAPNAIAFEIWVMFETESGNRVRLICKPNDNYIVGDQGYLKWQGTKLFSFERGRTVTNVTKSNSSGSYSHGAAPMPQGHIPAWKQVEMEREKEKG